MKQNNKQNVIEIDLLKILKALWKKAWIIILVSLLGAALCFCYAKFIITPEYESSIYLYVNNSSFSVGSTSFSISSSDISAARSLTDTYIVILKTRSTLEDVIEVGNLDMDYETLLGKISASAVDSTEIFSVTVRDTSPIAAEKIVNTIANVLPDKISSIVDGSSVRVVDYGVVNSQRVSPSYTKYTAMGFLVAFIIMAGIVAVLDYMDDVIYSEDQFVSRYDIPILAIVPDLDEKARKYDSAYYYSYEYGKEEDNKAKKKEKSKGEKKDKEKNKEKSKEKKKEKEPKKEKEKKQNKHKKDDPQQKPTGTDGGAN